MLQGVEHSPKLTRFNLSSLVEVGLRLEMKVFMLSMACQYNSIFYLTTALSL